MIATAKGRSASASGRQPETILRSEDQRQLRAPLPVRAIFRLHEVVVGGETEIDRQLSNPEHAPRASADGYGPFRSRRLPVGGDDRGAGHVPAAAEVVVDEGLGQEIIVAVAERPVRSAERPDVVDEPANDPWPLRIDERGGRAASPDVG